MLRILFIVMFLLSSQPDSYAQQSIYMESNSIPPADCVSIDALSSYVRQNFNTDTARVRAIYSWVANNISYDVARFQARDKSNGAPLPTAAEVLSSRTAVCQGYADLFIALCKGAGIEALRIGGYTKQQGKVSEIAHAWVAAHLDGTWFLFDPTWGAGSVRNEVFVKRYNNRFFKVAPIKFIEDHMPCDPLFQFLSYPLSHQEFRDGKPASGKTLLHYADSIQQHTRLSYLLQTAAELRRLEAAGVTNKLLQERQAYLRQVLSSAASKDAFEEAGKAYNTAVSLYNGFIGQKRKQFTTISDSDLKRTVDSIEIYIQKSRSLVSETVLKTDAQREVKARQIASIDKFWIEFIKQKDFTVKYLATEKEKRKQLFMKN